jgi:phage-related protein
MKKPKDEWAWTDVDFEGWRGAVDRRMLEVYAISIEDSGFDDDVLRYHWEEKESPFEFVLWFGNKYDLDPIETFGHALK